MRVPTMTRGQGSLYGGCNDRQVGARGSNEASQGQKRERGRRGVEDVEGGALWRVLVSYDLPEAKRLPRVRLGRQVGRLTGGAEAASRLMPSEQVDRAEAERGSPYLFAWPLPPQWYRHRQLRRPWGHRP